MSAVAVVGLGAMGARLARRLLDAKHDVVVWNRNQERAAPLVALGATSVGSPAEATRRSDVVLVMVADDQALRAVSEGAHGLQGGADERTTVIQMSTVSPEGIARLAKILPAGTGLLDAPVLGSLAEAEAGALKIFAGGPPELVERCLPLLAELGDVLSVGPVGAGTAAKLVANATLLGAVALLGEALKLADALDLPRDVAFDVLGASALAAQAERRRPAVEANEFPPRFYLSLAVKDSELIRAAGGEAELRLVEAARSWYRDAEAAGRGDDDYSAVLAYILEPGGPPGSGG